MNNYELSYQLAKKLKPTIIKNEEIFIESQEATPVEFYSKTKGGCEIKAHSLDCSNFQYDSADKIYIQLFNNEGNLTLKTSVINCGTYQDKSFEMFAKLGKVEVKDGPVEIAKSTKSFSSSLSKMQKMQKSILWQKEFEKAFYEIADMHSGVDNKNRKQAAKVQLNVLTLKQIRKDRQCYAAAGIIHSKKVGELIAVVGIGETIFIECFDAPVFNSNSNNKNGNRPIYTCYAELDDYFEAEESEESEEFANS